MGKDCEVFGKGDLSRFTLVGSPQKIIEYWRIHRFWRREESSESRKIEIIIKNISFDDRI